MAASSFISLKTLPPTTAALTSISMSRPRFSHKPLNPTSLNFSSSPTSISRISSSPSPRTTQIIWRISATTSEQVVMSQGTPVPLEEITASEAGGGVSIIISVLLFIAFVGLSILTIGVIYIAVTDFLTKREREKFEKEEAEKKKKRGGKKGVLRAKAGPKGFGQKLVEDDEFLDD